MKNSFESNLIKIPAKEVVDELYGQPLSKGEKDIAEFRKKKIKKPERSRTLELFSDLIARETEALKKYFGLEIKVPDLPEEITEEKLEFWNKNQFALHYSPGIEIRKNDNFPGQKEKLNKDIYKWIEGGQTSPDAIKLPTGWILVDARPRPEYVEGGSQMYDDDILSPVLEKLRKDGQIKDSEFKGSRFKISYDELNKTEVKAAIADVLNVKAGQVSMPKAVLWNYLGNAFYPEWEDTKTSEWLEDRLLGDNCMYGGHSVNGGLSYIGHCHSNWSKDDDLGFRPVIYFSEK